MTTKNKQLGVRVDDITIKRLAIFKAQGYNASVHVRRALHKMLDEFNVPYPETTDEQA